MRVLLRYGFWWGALIWLAAGGCASEPAQSGAIRAGEEISSGDREGKPLLTIDGVTLTTAGADALIRDGAAADRLQAVQHWKKLQLKTAEARRRGLDKQPGASFLMEVYQKRLLARLLDGQLRSELPKYTEDDLQAYYQENIKKYGEPWMADFRHISINDKVLAEAAAAEAKKPGADFAQLIQKYSADKGASDASFPPVHPYEALQYRFGDEVAEAVRNSQAGDILGPLPAKTGFEVIKVIKLSPAKTYPFAQVRDYIKRELKHVGFFRREFNLVKKLEAKADIVKSPELIRMEEESAKKAKPQKPGAGGSK